MSIPVQNIDVFGFIRPYNDVHSLGISNIGNMLENCNYKVVYGDKNVAKSLEQISKSENISFLINWIRTNKITRLGFSYRLDPKDAQKSFGKTYSLLRQNNLFYDQSGPIKQLYFAGLPEACLIIKQEYNNQIPVFWGDETQIETLKKIGITVNRMPNQIIKGSKYDIERDLFARQVIEKGKYNYQLPPERVCYKSFGTKKDKIEDRIFNNKKAENLPLFRAHVGPYHPNHKEAMNEFISWIEILKNTKYLDILSVGTSQLSQSNFGENWEKRSNGGGVPVNSESDLVRIYEAAKPMLVRIYAGTKNIPQLASIYEKTLNIAWHALSLWWFNELDGRGPYSVLKNLEEHFRTLRFIAKTGKPYEPNIPHHFAFRGSDDYSYVLSSLLAIKTAKLMGVKSVIVQIMLNTPKQTWGIQDIAKARALMKLARNLESTDFKIYLQTRAGLDYFSFDLNKAKVQLASVTALMDDVEPEIITSPDIIHIVSYCEAQKLATPEYINESIQITINALNEYRQLKKQNGYNIFKDPEDISERTEDLYNKVNEIFKIIENNVPELYSPLGLFEVFKSGVFPVPYLWERRDLYPDAVKWQTKLINGSIKTIGRDNRIIDPVNRINEIFSEK